MCPATRYDVNSTFQANLATLFSSLNSNSLYSSFYNDTVEGGTDRVCGLYFCTGDLPLSDFVYEWWWVVEKDAEDKQVKNTAVNVWLRELRDVLYDVEDLHHEYTPMLLCKSRADKDSGGARIYGKKTKMCNILKIYYYFLSHRGVGKFQHGRVAAHIVRPIRGRLDKIAKEHSYLGL